MHKHTVILVALGIISVAGCSGEDLSISPDEGPDGTVEILTVSGDQIGHEAGTFKSQVRRSDDVLVLVDFWAEWCSPCRMMNPELESVKKQWGDGVVIVKVDITENEELAKYFQVHSIPHVRIFRTGKPESGFSGLHSAAQINRLLKSLQ